MTEAKKRSLLDRLLATRTRKALLSVLAIGLTVAGVPKVGEIVQAVDAGATVAQAISDDGAEAE